MAVAMEVASWRGSSEVSPGRKKRAWGADAQQLMQLMMGQLQHPAEVEAEAELTLDLLGKAADPALAAAAAVPLQLSPEFLHLDPEDSLPLPSGWEKCLDLQELENSQTTSKILLKKLLVCVVEVFRFRHQHTGKLYFVNKSSGVSSFDDPRKQPSRTRDLYTVEIELQTVVATAAAQEAPLAHEFLGSKKSETESLKGLGCSSSSSGSPPRDGSSSCSKRRWTLHQHRHNNNNDDSNGAAGGTTSGRDDSTLELDLNLAAGGSSSSSRFLQQQQQQGLQAVCTMEMIQNALRITSERNATTAITATTTKRERETSTGVGVPRLRLKSVVSSSFSSLTNSTTRSDPSAAASPSTSSSSSASSRSGAAGLRAPPSTTGVCEAESLKRASMAVPGGGALVMGACTRCLMYVMLNKADPRCPRCESKVPVDFAPPCKKQRPGLKLGFGSR